MKNEIIINRIMINGELNAVYFKLNDLYIIYSLIKTKDENNNILWNGSSGTFKEQQFSGDDVENHIKLTKEFLQTSIEYLYDVLSHTVNKKSF